MATGNLQGFHRNSIFFGTNTFGEYKALKWLKPRWIYFLKLWVFRLFPYEIWLACFSLILMWSCGMWRLNHKWTLKTRSQWVEQARVRHSGMGGGFIWDVKEKHIYTRVVAALVVDFHSCCLNLSHDLVSHAEVTRELYPSPLQCIFSEVLERYNGLSDSTDRWRWQLLFPA